MPPTLESELESSLQMPLIEEFPMNFTYKEFYQPKTAVPRK